MSSLRSDEFAKYAPRWVREGTAKPRDAAALPLAPQLPTVHSSEPPWRGPSPFEGDVRHWRTRAAPEQHSALETPPVLVTGAVQVGMLEKAFRTAAIVSFAVIAMGALGLVLFPNAPKEALQSTGPSTMAATDARGAPVSQREKYAIAKSTSRVGVPDPQPAAPALAETAPKSANNAPVAQRFAAVPQVANAVYVVANAEPPAQPRTQQPVAAQQVLQSQPPQPQPQIQPAQVPQLQAQPAAAAQGMTSLAPQRVRSQRILSPDELDRLINRGEAFLAQGDVSAARLVLERAAEARDPRAALALGSTYDPNVLRRMGAVGVQADPEQARTWYERAAEFGSGEANQRLTALAQLSR